MATNFKAFNRKMVKAAKNLTVVQGVLFHKKISLEVLRGVVEMSPVDTGRFRGNWQLGLDFKPTGEISMPEAAVRDPFIEGLGSIGPLKFGQIVWITNNVPYAQALEDGHSKAQAPHGMVKITLARIGAGF